MPVTGPQFDGPPPDAVSIDPADIRFPMGTMPVTDTDDLLARAEKLEAHLMGDWAATITDLRAEVERLQAENSKLRSHPLKMLCSECGAVSQIGQTSPARRPVPTMNSSPPKHPDPPAVSPTPTEEPTE